MGTTRSWTTLIAEARRAARSQTSACWEIGDLALEAIPGRNSGPTGAPLGDSIGERIEAFAKAVGLNPRTVTMYRSVSRRWPRGHRNPNACWQAHYILRALSDRFEIIKSVSTADQARDARRGTRDGQHSTAHVIQRSINKWNTRPLDERVQLVAGLLESGETAEAFWNSEAGAKFREQVAHRMAVIIGDDGALAMKDKQDNRKGFRFPFAKAA